MSDILCLYYSRSGNTRQTMAEIAEALEAELVEFTDGVDRQGRKGYFRSGLDAMRRSTHPLEKFETAKPLEEYRLVILGSPVWAGRCASPVRGLLKRRGQELSRVAYVLTRGGDRRYEEVYRQMDSYTAQPHLLEALAEHLSNLSESVLRQSIVPLGRMIFGRGDSCPLLEELKMPALVITGEQDAPRPPLEGYLMAEMLNCKQLVVPQAGHICTLEQPEWVNEALLNFLMSIVRR